MARERDHFRLVGEGLQMVRDGLPEDMIRDLKKTRDYAMWNS